MSAGGAETRAVDVAVGDLSLAGDLTLPAGAEAIVLFAHGSGSSRSSPRNRLVAAQLGQAGLATLLFDLLTPAEEEEDRASGALRFDVPLLAERLARATDYVRHHSDTRRLAVGYFGAGAGAAAALIAAAGRTDVRAIVLRGGRPDLAEEALDRVAAPTLLIVGGADHPVAELNARACARLTCTKRIEVVAGATHLFEEPGALEEVTRVARDWFVRYLVEESPTIGLLTSQPGEGPG
jgi:predicted alpha/beta-hydrolase family hydrolase